MNDPSGSPLDVRDTPATRAEAAPSSPKDPITRLVYRDGAGELHLDWTGERIPEALADRDGILWVDLESTLPQDQEDFRAEAILRDVFGFHPLAVEDAIAESNLPKIDDWGEYLYLVFHATSMERRGDALKLHEIDIFLGANFVLTYHTEPIAFLEGEWASILKDPRDRLRRGADHLLARFLEVAVDQSLKTIEQLDDRLDHIQNRVLDDPSPAALRTIFRVKRAAIRLHKLFGPQREVLNRLARDPYDPVRAENRVYFRDVYDHVVRVHDISEGLRDLIAGTLETYLSVMSNRTNDIMKTLTMVTVMFMPMSFLTGFFGMNFFGETLAFEGPLPRRTLFLASLAVMALSPAVMWTIARLRRWI
ncbi:Magnesium transport protein CorA [Aquisphaera giovannonii]|uniref:Magnesium transport protein CorA n=1 Tax=Aquisphaera giovannonii TaxID=406548 RepID=A0A5B9VY34_9BACT|nr:magnesium transporter CorA family protein [Aquisphaera giovannonii]QEH33059.1 Magnesium transport protein CorA [Aquisphaera giovannonii]